MRGWSGKLWNCDVRSLVQDMKWNARIAISSPIWNFLKPSKPNSACGNPTREAGSQPSAALKLPGLCSIRNRCPRPVVVPQQEAGRYERDVSSRQLSVCSRGPPKLLATAAANKGTKSDSLWQALSGAWCVQDPQGGKTCFGPATWHRRIAAEREEERDASFVVELLGS